MNDYRSWSFTDRSFLFAVLVSVLWHLFWFFSVTIVVTPPARRPVTQPKIVSLGAVIDDAIFKTLVESRPEISKAFYRQPADFSSATDVPMQTAERYSPGDIVSLPFGKKFVDSLRQSIGGRKSSPQEPYFELAEPLDASQVLSRPDPPSGISSVSKETEMEFSLDEGGNVIETEVLQSGGDAQTDALWEQHLSRWIFSPEAKLRLGPGAKGRVRFRPFSEGGL